LYITRAVLRIVAARGTEELRARALAKYSTYT